MDEYFNRLVSKVDQSLLKGLSQEDSVLEGAIYYALSVKGKRLRPMLFLTLIDAFKKDPLAYMDIACAIEHIHTYSLIHDDLPIMDDDDFRRGMPTVHKKFGEAIALLAGDTLLTMAFERISWAKVSPVKIVNILKILTTGIGKDGMAGGQALDLEFEGEKNTIFQIHRMKTAEFLKGVLLAAAEIVDMGVKEKELLGSVGISMGTAFQMVDDLLDIEGEEEKVGKKLQKDIVNQSPNSVLFFGKDFIKKEIDALYKKTLDLLKEMGIDFPPFLRLVERMVYRSK